MKSVCVYTFVNANNYGAVLQAYALKRHLESMGFDVFHYSYDISYPSLGVKGWLRGVILKLVFSGFRSRNFRLVSKSELSSFGTFVFGSDQIWNQDLLGDGVFEFLGCAGGVNVSYAASFGELPAVLTPEFVDKLKGFEAVSVRESSAAALLESFGVESVVVTDPVMLLPDFIGLVDSKYYRKGVCCYFFNENNRKCDVISEFASEYGGAFHLNVTRVSSGVAVPFPCVEKWVSMIAGSEFVLTDSFHCMVVAIMNKRPFYVVPARMDRFSRISDLLVMLDLEDRIVSDVGMIGSMESKNIDYDAVHQKIEMNVNHSRKFLEAALGRV